MTAEFGATGAGVFDAQGPLIARPVRITPRLIVDMGEAPEGAVGAAPAGAGDGLVVTSQMVREADSMRLAAAWDSRATRGTELQEVASALSDWLAESGPAGARTRFTPSTDQLDRGDFSTLIDTIPAVVYIAELGEMGKWTYVSPQIETTLGYTPDEWMSDPTLWYRSVHPDDLEHARSFEDERLVGIDMPPPAEYRLRTRDGRYIWVYERARLLRQGRSRPTWYGVLQDVTALKTAEIELQRKAGQQSLLADLARIAVRGEDPEQLLRITVARLAELDRVIEASIWELDEDRSLNVRHGSGNLGQTDAFRLVPGSYPEDAVRRGEAVFVPSWTSDDPRFAPYRELVPDEAASSYAAPILGTEQQFGLVLVHSDRKAAFGGEDGDFLIGVASVLGNAIERNRSDRSLHHRLNHDILTELPNRRSFATHLAEAIDTAEKDGSMVALVYLDIDHFKLINDTVGHWAGDEVLRLIAPRLAGSIRTGDTVSRSGGDEFGIILRSVAGPEEAFEVANRILATVSEPLRIEGVERRITASVGISTWHPADGLPCSPEDLIQKADAAMHGAKDSGRDQAQIFDNSIQARMAHRLEIEGDLHTAIDRGELTVRYQPIIELKRGRLTGFEALVRWNHPVKGLLSPDQFIPVAEESGLIREIDTWVLREAAAEAARWNRDSPDGREVGLSVNCSARQIGSTGLSGLVADLLARHELPPELLTFELTERTLLLGSPQVSAVIEELDRIGVRLSLDDFGTGFSSLGYLAEFPLDELKVDRRFVELLGNGDHRGSAITDAIVQIGRALSMTVVAEGISDDQTLETGRELGCARAQGHLFAHPMTAPAARELVRSDKPVYPLGVTADSAAG